MQNVMRQSVSGNTLADCRYEGITDAAIASFRGTAYYRNNQYHGKEFSLGAGNLFTHVLVLGSSQSGKTNTISQLVAQLAAQPDSVCVIFDTKGDYKAHRAIRKAEDLVLEFSERCPAWNIFDEITANGYDDQNVSILAREIAQALFQAQKNTQNPFFYQAASELFTAVLRCFVYESIINPTEWRHHLNNRSLKNFILTSESDGLNRLFDHCSTALPDVQNTARTYLGTKANTQGMGVVAELRLMINRCFQGIFELMPSEDHPSFSITRMMRTLNKGNIFIEYDIQKGAALSPVYSLLFDLAMKETLSPSRSGNRSSNMFFVLDELKLLPYISHLEDALNYGRSNRVSVIAGLQSVHQLAETYRDGKDKVVLGGFGTLIAMKLNDSDSRQYVSQTCGTNIVLERTMGMNYLPTEQQRVGYVVEDWDLQALTTGEAVIKLSSQTTPFKFKFSKDPFK